MEKEKLKTDLSKNLNDNQEDVYEAPQIVEVFQLEALAVLCTDINAKMDEAFGCNPGALHS